MFDKVEAKKRLKTPRNIKQIIWFSSWI